MEQTGTSFKFTGVVGREKIIAIWPLVTPLLVRAINAFSEHQLDEVFESILNREMQLWIALETDIEAVLVTRIADDVCYIELCAGEGIESLPFLEIVENWAVEAGCKKMSMVGRKGWQRVLKDYQVKKVILEKEIGR